MMVTMTQAAACTLSRGADATSAPVAISTHMITATADTTIAAIAAPRAALVLSMLMAGARQGTVLLQCRARKFMRR